VYLLVADPGRLAVPLVEDLVQMLAFCVADGGWLGRTERLDRLVAGLACGIGFGGGTDGGQAGVDGGEPG